MVGFHETAITPSCRQALDQLRKHSFIHDFYLAGGTALALQIGHRVSTDLDWFSSTRVLLSPERETIRLALDLIGESEIVSEQDGMLYMRLSGTDVSFIYQHHPLLMSTVAYQGVQQLAAPIDIGLMKLAAINSRGTRRDFVDLYCLQEIAPLDHLLELVSRKYADRPSFLAITAKALAILKMLNNNRCPRCSGRFVGQMCNDIARALPDVSCAVSAA